MPHGSDIMSRKRRNTSSPESDGDLLITKRLRPSWVDDFDPDFVNPTSNEQQRIDPTCGQRGAFPGLDEGDHELIYGPPSDGIEYLRVVR